MSGRESGASTWRTWRIPSDIWCSTVELCELYPRFWLTNAPPAFSTNMLQCHTCICSVWRSESSFCAASKLAAEDRLRAGASGRSESVMPSAAATSGKPTCLSIAG